MNTLVTVPVEGAIHVYTPGTLPVFATRTPVRVDLSREGKKLGSVTFGVHETEENLRATELAFLLTGAYIKVVGEALFEVLDEPRMAEYIGRLLAQPKPREDS